MEVKAEVRARRRSGRGVSMYVDVTVMRRPAGAHGELEGWSQWHCLALSLLKSADEEQPMTERPG